jgi:PAS domain S-box-containing protein
MASSQSSCTVGPSRLPDPAGVSPADDRFRLLVEGVQDYAVFMLDPEGWVTTWNAGAERIKGYAHEEVIGRHCSLFYPPEDVERGKPARELLVAAESGRFEDEGWRVRKDGSRFWANVVITPLRLPNGALIGFAKVIRDLTQRRQVEDALRRSEARLTGIIASAMDAIISVNEEQRIVVFNAAAEAMFRCPAHEAVGKSLNRFIPQRFREAHATHIDAFARTGVTSRSMWTPGTLVGLRADGTEFPIEATISQVETGGQKFFTVILRDVTERKRAEEVLRQTEAKLGGIIASAMDAIISVNEAHEIVVFNAAAEHIFGCPAADAIGSSIHRFLPGRFRAAHERHIRAFATTGVTTRSMGELRPLMALRVDGTEFPIEATISQVDVGGQRLFTVILRDITERKRSEAERDRLLREAERQTERLRQQAEALEDSNRELARLAHEAAAANKAKSEFLAMMSHELRTPLNAIGGYAQLLEMELRGPITAEQRTDLHRIQRSGQHLLAVINNILNFARLEAAQLEYNLTDVVLADAIAEVSVLLEPQMSAKAITYDARVCDRELAVRADVDKLRQILLNLLTNATKFTEPGGRISVECVTGPDHVEIRVRDTGCGIALDEIERIFEPFVQLERSLTNTVQGTGLGLAISRDLARGMDGDLVVESVVGVGSTFTVALPLAAASAHAKVCQPSARGLEGSYGSDLPERGGWASRP